MTPHRVPHVESLERRALLAAATINWTDVQQSIDGFGASTAWMWGTAPSAAMDQAFSATSGAGLSLLRVRMAPNGWTSESSVAEQAGQYGARVWSTPWSPPREFKTNHDNNNGGSLDSAHYQDYANLLAGYVEDLNRQGVPLYAISLQNEPNWTAEYESCRWNAQQFADFMPYVGQTFAARGLTTKIMFPESLNWSGISTFASTVMANSSLAQYVGILAGHNYGETSNSYQPVSNAGGKPVWETEVSSFVAGSEMDTAIDTADDIHQAMSDANASAYHYWWLNASGTGGLMDGNWNPTKRLWAMGQYSRFVRPGWVRIGETDDGGLDITTFKDPASGKFALVVVNKGSTSITESFTLNGVSAANVTPYVTSSGDSLAQYSSIALSGGTQFNATIAGNSIVTYYGVSSSAASLQAPTNLRAAPVQGNMTSKIALSWNDNSSGESAYTVERSTNGTSWSVLSSTLAANTTTYVDSGLAENTRYYYRVKPTNGDASTYCAVASTSTVLAAQNWWNVSGARTSTGVNLTWNIDSATSTGVSIDRSTDGLLFTNIANLATRATSYSDTIPGYDASRIYYYRVRNTAGTTSSASTGWNTGLATPTNFTAKEVTSSQMTLAWTSPTIGATGARIERYNASTGNWDALSPSSLRATDGVWTLTGLASGTSYRFRMQVSSAADSVNSSYTADLNVTTPFQTIWYKANETSGSTLNDSFNSANNATLSGTYSFAAGASGNALILSGGYATLPAGVVSSLNDFTIATWVNVSSLDSWARVFDFGSGTNTYMFLTLNANGSGLPRFSINDGSGEQQVNSSTAIPLNTWTHIAVTLSGNTATLYINGAAAGTNTGMTLHPSALGATTQNCLGKSQYSWDPTFQGGLDDFRIHGRALSASEIQQLATVSDQLAWYKADETSSAVLSDSSGTGNEASLAGSYSFGTGVNANALALTGGYASVPTGILGGVNDFTVATWIKLSSIDNWARIFDFGTSTSNYMFLTAKADSGLPRFAITTGSGEQQINSSTAITANAWTHVAVTLSGNTATMYINGVVAGTTTGMTIHPASLGVTTQNYLGKSRFSDPALQGSLDDFRLYSRALSASEVKGLYSYLPSGWSSADVGGPSLSGSATYISSADTWTATGGGADIWNSSDQFQYAYRSASGDFAIVARVSSVANANSWAKAGVMIRDGIAASAAYAIMAVRPDNQAVFQWRAGTGSSAQGTTLAGGTGIKYVKLERTAGTITGYYSSDGLTWTAAAAANVSMSNAVTAGLAVTSHDNTKLCTATFDNVKVLAAATVTSISINAGAAQRSRVTSVNVAFSSAVTLASGAIVAVRRSDHAVFSTIASNPGGDQMNYVVAFTGAGLESGSLPDGMYDLTIYAASVRNSLGQSITGGNQKFGFHRLFGDANGDRSVNNADLALFRSALTGKYVSYFDYDNDGAVTQQDYAQLKKRLLKRLL